MTTVKTKIRCAVSGIVTGCRPDVFDKRVEKYGSVDAMMASYVCSEAKRMLRAGRSIDDIRSECAARGISINGLPTADSLAAVVSAFAGESKSAPATSKKGKAVTKEIDPDVSVFVDASSCLAREAVASV